MIVLNSFINIITFIIKTTLIVIIMNLIISKDFRKLISKIKRVILNSRETKKITQIQKILYNYFFLD